MSCESSPAPCRPVQLTFLAVLLLCSSWHTVSSCLDQEPKMDPQSKAVLSPVVFVGRFEQLQQDPDNYVRAIFKLQKKLKANDIPPGVIGKKRRIHVLFSNASGDIFPARVHKTNAGETRLCALKVREPSELVKDDRYVVYASPVLDAPKHAKGKLEVTLLGRARPDKVVKQLIKTVKKVCCRNCGKPAAATGLSDTTLEVKSNLKLKCVIEGNPPPTIEWYKDNKKLKAKPKDRFSVTTKNNVSTLDIRQVRIKDSGNYTCRASNVLDSKAATSKVKVVKRTNNRKSTTVPKKPGPSNPPPPTPTESPIWPPKGTNCPDDNFCLNGGACMIVTKIEERYCSCADGFRGNRCEFKDISTQVSTMVMDEHKGVLIILEVLVSLCLFYQFIKYVRRIHKRLRGRENSGRRANARWCEQANHVVSSAQERR